MWDVSQRLLCEYSRYVLILCRELAECEGRGCGRPAAVAIHDTHAIGVASCVACYVACICRACLAS